MYIILVVTYFLIYLISNVNPILVNNSNLNHLDSLYFKHNRRHKLSLNRIPNVSFIGSFKAVFDPSNLHIENFERIKYIPSELKRLNTHSHISFCLNSTDDNSDKNEPSKDEKPNKESQSTELQDVSKLQKKTPEYTIYDRRKHRPIKDEKPNTSTFRASGNISDQISQYESLMHEVEDLSKSKEKTDKDLYSFIKKNLKESSIDLDSEITTGEILRSIQNQAFGEDLQEREWIKFTRRLRSKLLTKLDSVDKIPDIPNPVEFNLEEKAKEDSCGFNYPIDGSPDDIYVDPEDYKYWGRTPLTTLQSTYPKRHSSGKLEYKDLKLDELITSTLPKHDKPLTEALKTIRETKFVKKMDDMFKLLEDDSLADKGMSGSVEDPRYRNIHFENFYEAFKREFLNSEADRQEQVLKVLNPYNPWDEFIKMRNLKSALPPIGLNYKIDLEKLRVSFNSNEPFSEEVITSFLKEYLHYFLIMESDEALFSEFKESKFLYDILKYFDLNEVIPIEIKKEHMDITDRFFRYYFPKECPDGFPKKPPESEFPLTIDRERGLMGISDRLSGRNQSYHRVNMVCCLMALVRSYPLVREYSSDIFTEQRFKMILDTLETGLSLELQRLELGVSEIEINNLNYKGLCQIDGVFLSTLTEILSQWNIRRGIENILDLTLLITLRRLPDIDGRHLVTIIKNISNLTTLPQNVYVNFLSKILDFVHQKIKSNLVNKDEYMDLDEALDFLSVLSNYPTLITRPFMESFMQLYRDRILVLGMELDEVKYSFVKEGKYIEEEDPEIVESWHRRRSQIFSLVSCLQLSGLKEYMYLLDELTRAFKTENMELNSVASISVLESFSEFEPFQKKVLDRIKNNLIRMKYTMDTEDVLKVLEMFVKGVKDGRLDPDPYFFCTMIKNFCSLKDPDSEQLVAAARITDEFSPLLTRNHLNAIFYELTKKPLYFNFLTRLGLRGEFLDYPIYSIAQVLYYSSKNGIVDEKNWKTFYDMVYLFKHILSLEDIEMILEAMIASNFTKADQLLEVLCKRVCNLIEISKIDPKRILKIMDKCMDLDYVPIHLLRFYTYSNLFDFKDSDHINSILEDPKEYDIDFRGWKRPVSYEDHTERLSLHHNVFPEVKMKGSRALIPESLKYSLPNPLTRQEEIRPTLRLPCDMEILGELARFVERVGESYQYSQRDRNLINTLMGIVRNSKMQY